MPYGLLRGKARGGTLSPIIIRPRRSAAKKAQTKHNNGINFTYTRLSEQSHLSGGLFGPDPFVSLVCFHLATRHDDLGTGGGKCFEDTNDTLGRAATVGEVGSSTAMDKAHGSGPLWS